MKRMLILGLVVTMSVTLFAGRKQQVWIVDDFESYGNTDNMLAGPFVGMESLANRGWWNVYTLQENLAGQPGTPPFPTIASLGIGDPNSFSAEGEIKDHPTDPNEHGMVLHYTLNDEGWAEANFILLAHNMGMPLHSEDTPLGPLAAVDLTQFDKCQFKIKKLAGNITDPADSAICLTFSSPDLGTMGYYKAQALDGIGILGTSEEVWEIMEFDMSAPLLAPHAEYGLENCIGILIGIEDSNNADVTFIIDDIIFYSESDECPEYLAADINGDCTVDMGDLAAIGSQWLK